MVIAQCFSPHLVDRLQRLFPTIELFDDLVGIGGPLASFNRVFKEIMEVSPTEYRASSSSPE